jgi:hypothetical protein
MGVMPCPIHGEGGREDCCDHVAAAARAGTPGPGIESRRYGCADGLPPAFVVWLCPECAAAGPWPASGTALDGGGFPDPLPFSQLRGVCVSCFLAWRAEGERPVEPAHAPPGGGA